MNSRRVGTLVVSMMMTATACAVESTPQGDAASSARVGSTTSSSLPAPATTIAPTTRPSTTTTTQPPTTTTTVAVVEEEAVVQGGPGVDHDVLMAALAPLIEAENAMHAFEADWDAGMTYSETFRGWREVRAIVTESFEGFAFPDDASTEQLTAGIAYMEAVDGAHLEWQNVTDFIVTYITNYTPEVLIVDAYQQAEFRLRDAISALEAIEAQGA